MLFSEKRFQDYLSGRLKGWSINLLPTDSSPPTPAEQRARPDWAKAKIVYRSGVLDEVSGTAIPGNKSCLSISAERSLARSLPAALPTTVLGFTANEIEAVHRLSAAERKMFLEAAEHPVNAQIRAQILQAANSGNIETAMAERDRLKAEVELLKLQVLHGMLKGHLLWQEQYQAKKAAYLGPPNGLGAVIPDLEAFFI